MDNPDRFICTCSLCITETVINNFGQLQPGKLVPKSTRINHRKRDQCPNPLAAPSQVPRQADYPVFKPVTSQRIDLIDGLVNRVDTVRQTLFLAICTLAAWLHLKCGLSRASTSRLLKVLSLIVHTAMELGRLLTTTNSLQQDKDNTTSLPPRLPSDVRSAMSALDIEPNIIRSICCPKCFSKYSLDSLPQTCLRREVPRAKICGERLWTIRSTRAGPRLVPARLYSSQDFESWLEFFLSRPGIEDLISKSYTHTPSATVMHVVWDSPAWRSLPGNFSSIPGNLTFSWYIDWFNPFTNKIAGKLTSCGAIIISCLNLPLELQQLPDNTFFAAITPTGKEPNVNTITTVMGPIVECLKPMWEGRVVKTYYHPRGIRKRAAILARVGDLPATRKALGFAGVASHNFCSFCKLRHDNMDNLDHLSWELRTGPEVLSKAAEWNEATTKKARKEIFKDHGVRWSSLHELPYGDPVRHTLLGVMHNWIEGVLQHHARIRWGIGVVPSKANKDDELDNPATTTNNNSHPLDSVLDDLDSGTDILDDELEDLYQESQQHADTPSHLSRMRSETLVLENLNDSDPEDVDFQPDSDESDDDSYNFQDNKVDDSWKLTCVFTTAELTRIHACLSDAIIPSWVERPPRNLGEKSHGKLKADQWFILFSIFLPLVLPEIWQIPSDSRRQSLLNNFYNLVTCTNIVCAYSVTSESANAYLDHYIKYRQSSRILFPKVGERPNHHYAMHNSDLMKFWGPLMPLSEFAGERHNGNLQNVETNSHAWELDFTMLRQMCRRGRLMARLRDSSMQLMISDPIKTLSDIILEKPILKEDPGGAGLKIVPADVYNAILAYLNVQTPTSPLRHAQAIPHPDNASVLPRAAMPIRHIKHRGRDYSTFDMHSGNSSVHFRMEGINTDSGHIEAMWRYTISGILRTFIVLSTHQDLSPQDEEKNPYASFAGFLAKIVYTRRTNNLSLVILEQDRIIGHVAYYIRPAGTFGIGRSTTVLVNSLHRNRE